MMMTKKDMEEQFSPHVNLWLAVKRDIEAKIIAGEYPVGSKIPTIVELGEQYNIGKTTVQKVINALDEEGIIIKKMGVGCFVKPYVRKNLLDRHKKEFVQLVTEVVETANLLGLEKAYVASLVEQEWEAASK